MKPYYHYSKYLKVKHITYILKKLTKLSSNDDKRLQTSDKTSKYPYGTSAGKVCKTELLECLNIK